MVTTQKKKRHSAYSGFCLFLGKPLVTLVKNLTSMQETQFRSLGREYPLEKEMATHSSILSWRIPWTQDRGSLEVVHEVPRV